MTLILFKMKTSEGTSGSYSCPVLSEDVMAEAKMIEERLGVHGRRTLIRDQVDQKGTG